MLDLDRSNWTRVRFGDVATASKEKCDPEPDGIDRFVAGEHMDTDELHISRWGNVGDGYLGPAFHRRFHVGDVLYGSRRTYLRKVAVAEFGGVTANTTFVIRPADNGVLLPELLPFVMTTEPFHQHAIDKSRGSVNPYVNWPDIACYEFDLPPLDQQKRIADLLWAVERHARSLRAQHNAADGLTTSVIERNVGRSRGQCAPLSSTLNIVRGGSPRPINDYFTEDANGLNWIKIGDVPPNGKYVTGTAQRILPSGLPRTRQVSPGDLILSNSMSYGRPYILKIDGCIHDGWLALSDTNQNWRAEYLYYLLRSQRVQASFEQAAGGSTVRNLKISAVGSVQVWCPSLSEQDEALAAIYAAESAKFAIEEEAAAARTVANTALSKLLGGVT